MKHPLLLALAAALITSGCAAYGPNNFWTGGYTDTQLAPDVFRITFQGSAWSGAQNAQDLAMLRAADLTVKNGFSYFAIMTSAEGAWRGSVTTPGQLVATGYGAGKMYYVRGTYTPGATIAIEHPRSGLLIKCFTSKPENIPVLDARFLQKSIRRTYNISPPR
jgi:hypothetical protein